MTLSDIWIESYHGGKANYFITINNALSLFFISGHGLFPGFDSPRLHQFNLSSFNVSLFQILTWLLSEAHVWPFFSSILVSSQ